MPKAEMPVGVIDSGIGGLSVAAAIQEQVDTTMAFQAGDGINADFLHASSLRRYPYLSSLRIESDRLKR